MFINYCVFFPLNFVIFLNSASSAAALVFYLPGVCAHNDTKGKQRMARVRNIPKSLEKKHTIINEHSVVTFQLMYVCTVLCVWIWAVSAFVFG